MSAAGTKHKVFISFYRGDTDEVGEFLDKWAYDKGVFTPKVIGVYDDKQLIDSDDTDYVMRRIREDYIGDATVTLVLIGKCTHSRRYVDWELMASLRRGADKLPNGVLGIPLPSSDKAHLPPRFADNYSKDEDCYARFQAAPTRSDQLTNWIEDAYNARWNRADLIKNGRERMKYNHKCLVHDITHPA